MLHDSTRYSCQIALPGFGKQSQQLLASAKVLIAGLGGLGCPAAQYLTAAGVGTLGLADHDIVSISNLHRQILYNAADVGLKKVHTACEKLSLQNPEIQIIGHDEKITAENIISLIAQYDIVIDCTDNFETKYLLNDACVLAGKPLVYGAIYQYEGQVAVWNVRNEDGAFSPHYRDVFPEANAAQIPNCVEGGVLPTLAGIIGTMQANEVIKYITKTGGLLAGKLLIIDALTLQSRIIKTGEVSKTPVVSLSQSVFIPVIDYDKLQKGLSENLYELIDVRTTDEHYQFNIGGRNIPLSEIDDYTPEDYKPIVFYCASGMRSAEAVKHLKIKYPQLVVMSLESGMNNVNKADKYSKND